jgi:hypothetical protein
MKRGLLFVALWLPIVALSQIANEANIPLTLDTDGDTIVDVIDTDDDNDGVLDNLDAFPLDNTRSSANTATIQVLTIADAGLRSTAPTTNYGAAVDVLTRNTNTRSLIAKFSRPVNLNLVSAQITIYTNTENDPLDIHILSDNSWTETGVTFSNAPTSTNTFLGTTGLPVAGKYTFNIPINALPTSGDFTIWIHDNTNEAVNETLFTKETAGKAATVDFTYYTTITPRVVVTPFNAQTTYLASSPFTLNIKLAQAPTGTVYIPLTLSDNTKATIAGDQVLVFDASNWSIDQTKTITPLAPGQFDMLIRPLHSTDNFYNGFNNTDVLGYTIQATNITNLGPWAIATGSTFTTTLNAVSAVGSTLFTYKLINAPIGMGIVENTGYIQFSPLSNQVGTWPITIQVKDDKGNISTYTTTIVVSNGGVPDPIGIYVVPYAPVNGTGTAANPFNSIPVAVDASAAAGGGNVYVRGGEYELLDIQNIGTVGSASNPIVIQPAPGETVKFNFGTRSNGFEFLATSRHIEFRNFEIDGGTDNVEFWCLPARAFWGDATVYRGGGIAIGVNGENITIAGNYIHNCYQKGVEIRTARYLKVYDNIIHSIATTSLSGGHGIMRQQSSGPLTTPDNGVDFRWDLMNNLIFNVEQRIYSWVPSKGFIDMVLDEGKPILIDDVSDAAAVATSMKARIMNNVVAYGSIDQIRLKSTNNLTVSNNTVYSASPTADGITDKVADPGNVGKFTSTILTNNAVQTMPGTAAYELSDIIAQGTSTGFPATITGNYAAVGNILPSGVSGVATTTGSLFIDANNGNFRLNPALGLPSTLGVSPTVLNNMDARVAKFGVQVKWDRWIHDHLKLTQTILDNIPGINDGIATNDTVFTSAGVLHLNGAARGEIDFDVVNGTWKTRTGSPAKQVFELNAAYEAWYEARNAATKNTSGTDYTRIRWGNSVAKQDQIFQNDWLTNSQITADTNTIIYSSDNHFTLDGDLLVDFEGYTPVAGDKWFLMQAATINTANTGQLFDRVLFEGATLAPAQYTLSIVNVPGGQALQLLIINTTLPISLVEFKATRTQENNIQLHWKTAAEINNKFFIVEKSANGNTWAPLIKINAVENVRPINAYTTIDHQPFKGISYYRLKQVDTDGRFRYSTIVWASIEDSKHMAIYPNPVVNSFIVKGITASPTLTFVITDVQGKPLRRFTNPASQVVDVSWLQQGMYILQVYDGNSVIYTSRFVKVK